MQIRPAQVTLNALNGGATMTELAQAIHDATGAVRGQNKPATVTLTISFEPMKGVAAGLKEAPLLARAEIATKLPKPELPTTLFYVDDDGNPTQQAPARQPALGLSIAGEASGS